MRSTPCCWGFVWIFTSKWLYVLLKLQWHTYCSTSFAWQCTHLLKLNTNECTAKVVSNSPCSINIFLSSLWVRQGAVWSTIHSVLVSGYWFTDLFFNCGQSWWSCQEALLCAGLHRTEAVRLHTYPRLCDCNRRLSHTQCVLTTPWSIQPWTLVESWVPSLLLSCSDVWMESMAECSFCLWCHRFTGEIMNSSRKLRPQTLQVLTLIPVVSHSTAHHPSVC